MDTARCISFEELSEGQTSEQVYVITRDVYDHFLAAFGDRSPIHVDAERARAAGFAAPVMHGAILNGFISHFLGMVFPGSTALLLSVDLRYSQPSFLQDSIRLQARVAQKVDAQQVIVLHIKLFNDTRQVVAASGRVQVKVNAP